MDLLSIPSDYVVQNPYIIENQWINTNNHQGEWNGALVECVNEAALHEPPISLVYFTICYPFDIKGPHVHLPPKTDRFVCIDGECLIVCRNEQTEEYFEFHMPSCIDRVLYIPPYVSHAIATDRSDATILSICSEPYVKDHYNQLDTEYKGFNWEVALEKYANSSF